MGETDASPDIDALIVEAAASRLAGDYDTLLEALRGRELFLNVVPQSDGRPRMKVALVAGDFRAMVLFHNRKNPAIEAPYAGVRWEDALEMLGKMADVDGLLVHSDGPAWVAIDKAKANELLANSATKH